MLTEYCWDQHSNPIKIQLQDNSVTVDTLANSDLSPAEKVAIVFFDDNISFNSVDDNTIISYTDDGIITLNLGNASDLAIGTYEAHIDVTLGGVVLPIRWQPDFKIIKT